MKLTNTLLIFALCGLCFVAGEIRVAVGQSSKPSGGYSGLIYQNAPVREIVCDAYLNCWMGSGVLHIDVNRQAIERDKDVK